MYYTCGITISSGQNKVFLHVASTSDLSADFTGITIPQIFFFETWRAKTSNNIQQTAYVFTWTLFCDKKFFLNDIDRKQVYSIIWLPGNATGAAVIVFGMSFKVCIKLNNFIAQFIHHWTGTIYITFSVSLLYQYVFKKKL